MFDEPGAGHTRSLDATEWLLVQCESRTAGAHGDFRATVSGEQARHSRRNRGDPHTAELLPGSRVADERTLIATDNRSVSHPSRPHSLADLELTW